MIASILRIFSELEIFFRNFFQWINAGLWNADPYWDLSGPIDSR